MSKDYPQKKFQSLAIKRQVQILIHTLGDILEKQIEPPWDLNSDWKKALHYRQWLTSPLGNESILLKSLERPLEATISRRQLYDWMLPFERYLGLEESENHFQIKVQDDLKRERVTLPLVFVLDHLRSSFNVGSIFRLADGLGVQKIELVGYSPTPLDTKVNKSSMGAHEWVPWSTSERLEDVIHSLRQSGYRVVALETCQGSQALSEIPFDQPIAMLVGNERFGLSEQSLQLVDKVVEIPMLGLKNSLNVLSALSIAGFEVAQGLRGLK